MYDAINRYLSKCIVLPQEDLAWFDSLLEYKKVPKKTVLLQEGEICRFEAYIIKGCIRNYYIDSNGFEVVLQFGIEDWWVSDIASFNDKKPSRMFIETMEDCELVMISDINKEELL